MKKILLLIPFIFSCGISNKKYEQKEMPEIVGKAISIEFVRNEYNIYFVYNSDYPQRFEDELRSFCRSMEVKDSVLEFKVYRTRQKLLVELPEGFDLGKAACLTTCIEGYTIVQNKKNLVEDFFFYPADELVSNDYTLMIDRKGPTYAIDIVTSGYNNLNECVYHYPAGKEMKAIIKNLTDYPLTKEVSESFSVIRVKMDNTKP